MFFATICFREKLPWSPAGRRESAWASRRRWHSMKRIRGTCQPEAEENLQFAARQIRESTKQRCLTIVTDVRQPEAVGAAVTRVVQELGSLDLVINNAAGNFFCPSAKLSPNGFGTVIDIDAGRAVEYRRGPRMTPGSAHGGEPA